MNACIAFCTNPLARRPFKSRSKVEENNRFQTGIAWRKRGAKTLKPGHISSGKIAH